MNIMFVLISMSVMAIAFGTAALASVRVREIKGEINWKGFGKDSESKLNKLARLQVVDKVAATTSVVSAAAFFFGIFA